MGVSHSHQQGQIAFFTMGFRIATLFKAPEVSPITLKARSIPFFNLVNIYGRVFFFSWFGFFVAFWSWYAFPPLLHDTIQKDLKLTKIDVSNSNIIALTATLLVRLIADRPATGSDRDTRSSDASFSAPFLPSYPAQRITKVNSLLSDSSSVYWVAASCPVRCGRLGSSTRMLSVRQMLSLQASVMLEVA